MIWESLEDMDVLLVKLGSTKGLRVAEDELHRLSAARRRARLYREGSASRRRPHDDAH